MNGLWNLKLNLSDIEKFIDSRWTRLKSVNSDYEAKRFKDLNLVQTVIRVVPRYF